jgi:hypothetical protein
MMTKDSDDDFRTVLSLVDIDGSVFNERMPSFPWNLHKWDSKNFADVLSRTHKVGEIPGISSSYTYVRSAGSIIFSRVEDADMPSVSFLFEGHPIVWFAIWLEDTEKFEK